MKDIVLLREHAQGLRAFAYSIERQDFREQLLNLASRCEALARTMQKKERRPALQNPAAPRPHHSE